MGSVKFTVYGRPQPAGSKRAFKHPHTGKVIVTDQNAKAKPWKQEISGRAAALSTDVSYAPISLDVTFVLSRPKSHYGTGKNAEKIKNSAPAFPTVAPDATKLLRGLEDALTGVLWRDDAQVVEQTVRKIYGSPERVDVVVKEMAS